MFLKDTSGVVQHSSRASETASGKLPEASALFASDSMVSKRILPIQPPPTSQPILVVSKTSKSILLQLPPKSPIIEPIIETPQVFETLSHQQ